MKRILPIISLIALFLSFVTPFQASAQTETASSDLAITAFQLTDATGRVKTTFDPGEPIFVKLTIRNQGTGVTNSTSTGRINHAYYRDSGVIVACGTPPNPTNFTSYSGTNFTPSSEYIYESRPDGEKESQFPNVKSFTQDTAGTYTARVFIDYDCTVTETNNNNNQATVTYTVGQPAPTPTLIPGPLTNGSTTDLPAIGSWIIDPEVTKIGQNASRSGMLLDWALRDYQWSFVSPGSVNPLIPFWQVVQRIVYALFLFVILVTSFILIITRGKSLSAKRFLPRFLLVILLVTFSFSLIQFLYQIVDIFQGFFLRNPQGQVIQSRDLLFIGFDYRSFQGLRLFGDAFEESALTSLLFVKLTSFTYYVMAILLIVRKIILWFFIILSPLFPILLLFYPVRNTAKIWVGEFFRWLLYAPLFALFLSGLVRLWQSSLPLLFDFNSVSDKTQVIYPTAVNILLGGPQQNVNIDNSINLPDTFALYLVAIIMLWVAIILPFILLQIFLGYMYNFNYKDSPVVKQMRGLINNRFPPSPNTPIVPVGPQGAGLARSLPFGKRFSIPTFTGRARNIPTGTTVQESVQRPISTQTSTNNEALKLTNISIPTMRDIARLESSQLSKEQSQSRETNTLRQTLQSIANPASVLTTTDRERFREIRDRLVTESEKGNIVATNILKAATNVVSTKQTTNISSQTQNIKQLLQQLSQPQTITNTTDRERITSLKERIIKEVRSGDKIAQRVNNVLTQTSTSQTSSLQTALQKLAQTQQITNTLEKTSYQELREKIVTASKSGNTLASLMLSSLESRTSTEQVKHLQEELTKASQNGDVLAQQVLSRATEESTKTSTQEIEKLQKDLEEAKKQGNPLATTLLAMLESKKAQQASIPATMKVKQGVIPQVNRIQQVSLDDYEAVKKMWKENYKNIEVPQTTEEEVSRKGWITNDIADIQQTISLLSSTNPEEIEQGMQKVSDILPFLLIGGFSQTEITAYLKAKLEAGKAVLEESEKELDEEETLLETTRGTTKNQNQMHMTATREIETPGSTVSNTTYVTNNISQDKTDISDSSVSPASSSSTPTAISTPTVTVNIPQSDPLLALTRLPLPTMKDIVRFESALRARNKDTREETEHITNTLTSLAHPEKLNQQEKEKFIQMKETLVKESSQGNQVASMMLAAIEQFDGETKILLPTQAPAFLETLRLLTDPSAIQDQTMREEYLKVHQTLVQAKHQEDQIAISVLKLVDDVARDQTDQVQTFLTRLSDPTKLISAPERTQFTKLKERLMQESEQGESVASFLLTKAQGSINEVEANKVRVMLWEKSQEGSTIATYIVNSMLSPTNETIKHLTEMYTKLVEAKEQKSLPAEMLLRLFMKELKDQKTKQPLSSMIPHVNRIQQVSLDDYEAVKKMWYENYLHAEVPMGTSGQPMTREEWIEEDKKLITQTLNLLSSNNPEEVNKGLENVSDVLPFLLLGGFSLPEIIGYLKAKKEAGDMALLTLKGQDTQEKVFVDEKKTTENTQVQTMEIPLPAEQKKTDSSS